MLVVVALPLLIHAQSKDQPGEVVNSTPQPQLSNDRIFGIIPNFQTVSEPNEPFVRLPVRKKWELFVRESIDPYTFATAAAGSAISHWRDSDPKYGEGWGAYFQRFGAAQADLTAQNLFSDALLASVLREDPRYFREGPGRPVLHRIGYAISRVVITKSDSGKNTLNISGLAGMGMGIALSNAYYPKQSRNGDEMESRIVTSLMGAMIGNLLPEFWPDIRAKVNHLRHK